VRDNLAAGDFEVVIQLGATQLSTTQFGANRSQTGLTLAVR
jgi:hypothetical protein